MMISAGGACNAYDAYEVRALRDRAVRTLTDFAANSHDEQLTVLAVGALALWTELREMNLDGLSVYTSAVE